MVRAASSDKWKAPLGYVWETKSVFASDFVIPPIGRKCGARFSSQSQAMYLRVYSSDNEAS